MLQKYIWVALLPIVLLGCGGAPSTKPAEPVAAAPTNAPATTVPEPTVTQLPPTNTPLPTPTAEPAMPWWNDEVFYQVFVRAYYDSDSDGIGDLQGLIERLDYLNDGDPTTNTDLGVTALWLMPIAQSPSYHGYDVIDYLNVEEDYGSNEDFKQLMDEAHARGMKVIIDMVLNHTSSRHPWFIESKQSGSAYTDWYLWEANNPGYVGPWGQKVWHPANGEYYYGVFWDGMPDLDYTNPDVTTQMYEVSEFWINEMGADGFRLDAIKHLIEDGETQENTPATIEWMQTYNAHLKTVNPQMLTVGEIWSATPNISTYVRNGSVDMAFEFTLAEAMLNSVSRRNTGALKLAQQQVLEAYPHRQYAAFLANHDQNRIAGQFLGDVDALKATASLLLTNPGVPFIYYGEEIGMVGGKPDERIRTPLQWDDTPNTAGFTTDKPWEPLQEGYQTINIAAQTNNPDSLLSHYRNLIHLRQSHPALRYGEQFLLKSDKKSLYAFILHQPGEETLLVVVNVNKQPQEDYTLSLQSGPLSQRSTATVLFGEADGEISPPTVNKDGGLENYTPAPIPGRGTLILKLE